ncbi:unnamed protein product, partial [Lymnaea stagnalis]
NLGDLNLFGPNNRRETVEDQGTHLLVCTQEPLEFGIVLDSSSSIARKDFQTGIKFLQEFLQQFEVGSGPNDVRVSIITYGKGIYPEDAFNLTTYNNKQDVIRAIGQIPHRAGLYTDTGLAIKYMHEAQLVDGVVRPGVEKIGLVITDGNSQLWKVTKQEAENARDDGINMFAIGVGVGIRDSELLNIAGDESRVTKVDNYDSLASIKESLAHKTCIKKEKPTTLPPLDEPCGLKDPADIYFVFSPSALGPDATAWTTSFISNTIDSDDLIDGFRYGVVSGSCPDDAGFDLDTYDNVDDIRARIRSYEERKLPSLVQSLAADGYTAARGARDGARKVAVIVATKDKKLADLQAEVDKLVADGVKVFIADPTGEGISVTGATTLTERSATQQSDQLITALCPSK